MYSCENQDLWFRPFFRKDPSLPLHMRQQASALRGLSNSTSSVDMPALLCGTVLKKLSCSALPQPPGQQFGSAG